MCVILLKRVRSSRSAISLVCPRRGARRRAFGHLSLLARKRMRERLMIPVTFDRSAARLRQFSRTSRTRYEAAVSHVRGNDEPGGSAAPSGFACRFKEKPRARGSCHTLTSCTAPEIRSHAGSRRGSRTYCRVSSVRERRTIHSAGQSLRHMI